jgi:hypothetical protein
MEGFKGAPATVLDTVAVVWADRGQWQLHDLGLTFHAWGEMGRGRHSERPLAEGGSLPISRRRFLTLCQKGAMRTGAFVVLPLMTWQEQFSPRHIGCPPEPHVPRGLQASKFPNHARLA